MGAQEGRALIGPPEFFTVAEECNASVAAVKIPASCVRIVFEAAGPWWKHENGVITSLPVGIVNKGAWRFHMVSDVQSKGQYSSFLRKNR